MKRPLRGKPARSRDSGLARRTSEAFGELLQRVRRGRGWKQDAFAEAMGVSRTTVSNIECGRQRVFLDQLFRAAEILGVPVADLLPTAQSSGPILVLHAAADDPLSATAARNLTRTIERLAHSAGETSALRSPTPKAEGK